MTLGRIVAYPAGLRARLSWLVVISLLPVFCFAIYASIQNQRERLARADANLLAIVRLAALAGERHVEGTRQLLNAIASGPSLKGDEAAAFCPAFLSNIRNASKYFNLGLIDTQGNLQCAAEAGDRALNFSDRAYFKEALSNQEFSIGEYQIGRITKLPSLNFGLPVYDNSGVLKGVAFAALDIARLEVANMPIPLGVELAITDKKGVILATNASKGYRIGEPLGDQALIAALQSAKDKTIERVDATGVPKIYATTAVGESESGKGIYVVANISKSAVITPLQIELAWILASIFALALAGMAVARRIGNTSILDPTRKLLQQINDLAGEDVSSKSAEKKSTNEIVALAGAFERMTGVLRAHDEARSQGEATLRLTHGRLLAAQRMGHIGNWEYDVKNDQVWWSEQTFEIYGLDRDQAPGRYADILARVHPADRSQFEHAQKELWAGGILDLKHRIVLDNGQVRWVHGIGEARFNAQGELSVLSGTVQDITEVELSAEAQRSSESLVSGVFQHAAVGIFMVDLECRFIRANQRYQTLVGRDFDELQSFTSMDLTHPDDQELESTTIKMMANGEIPSSTFEKRYIKPDLTVVWTSLSLCLLRDESGKPLHFVGVAMDIAERRQNEIILALEADVLQAVSLSEPLNQTLEKLVRGVEQLFPNALASIHILSQDGSRLNNAIGPSLPQAYLQSLEDLPIGPAVGSCGTAAFLKETVVVEDIQTDPLWVNFRHLAQQHGLQACWSVPILDSSDLVIATFAVYHTTTHSPTERMLLMVEHLRYLVGIAVDQHRKETALRRSEERFRNTFLDAATGIAISAVGGPYLQVNAAYCAMVGYTESELRELTPRFLTHAEDWPKTQAAVDDILSGTQRSTVLEKRYLTKGGSTVWIRLSLSAMSSVEGEPQLLVGVVEDITERRSAKEALLRAQGLLTMASQVSRLGAWQITLPEMTLNWSDEVFMIYELSPGITPDVHESIKYYAPESVPIIEGAIDACISEGISFDVELQLITEKTNYRTVRAVGRAVRDPHGAIVRVEGAIQDVTARRAEQTQLQLLQAAVSRLNDIVLITEAEPFDEPGPRIVFVNDAFQKRTGYKPEEVIGKTPRILQGPKTQPSELKRISEALRRWQPIRSELINYTKSGELFWIELDIVPIADASGTYTHWVAVERDITARKKSEEEIMTLYAELDKRVQQRTAELQVANQELESFSYSVSHDLRSPLNTIAGFSQLLEKLDGDVISTKGRHYLSRIQTGAKVMGELIEGLLALAQLSREKLKYEQTNLSLMARRVEISCHEQNPTRKVEFVIQDDLVAWGDPRLLMAVLQNLIGNAWKFTSAKENARIEFFREQCADGTTCFAVRDNGAGFDMNFADKLFGTFQRLHTQSEFSGTGVGLTIVKRVVEKHGGKVWATSKVGEGATFRFTLSPKQGA